MHACCFELITKIFVSKLKHYDNYTKFDRVFKLNIRRNFQYLKKTTKVISIEINVEKISDYVKNFTSFLLFGNMHIDTKTKIEIWTVRHFGARFCGQF